MYYMPEDKFYMIPTSEVPVTNIYRDEMLKEAILPIRMTAYSPCFRREAGSFGKDVRGLNRVHQFEKVEIVQITKPTDSYQALDEMVAHVEKLLNTLELPYRILRLCGGDMSFASAITYDFEVYSAAQEKWLEVSSVSNFETYQSNRMKIRYKDAAGKSQLVHTLNGSSLALPRIIACLLENNQSPEGIKLPAAIHPYFGSDSIVNGE
jgi:seryl-tRNA synthetase